MKKEMIQNILRMLEEQIQMFCKMGKCQKEQKNQRYLDYNPANSFHKHCLDLSAKATCDISNISVTVGSEDIKEVAEYKVYASELFIHYSCMKLIGYIPPV